MKRRAFIALAASAVLVVAVGASVAYANSVATNVRVVDFDQAGTGDTDDYFYGHVDTSRKCQGARTVKMLKQTSNGYKLVDTDRSSKHGAWATHGNVTGQPPLKFVATKSTRGNTVCKADSTFFS